MDSNPEEKVIFVENHDRLQPSLCEECGGKVGKLKVEKDAEGWMWCQKCGLVKNDGVKKRLEELGEGAWFDLVRIMVPNISIRELRRLSKSKSRLNAVQKLKKMKMNMQKVD